MGQILILVFLSKYNYKRAKCKDPKIINRWFRLIANTKAKYGITDKDIYNFNKLGFIIGVILTGVVVTGFKRQNWLK